MTMRPKFNRGTNLLRPSSALFIDKHSVTTTAVAPTTDRQGIDVSKHAVILLSVTSDQAYVTAPAGLAVDVVIWRLKLEPNVGQIAPSGGWYCRERLTVGLDGNPDTGAQEFALPALNSEKMFYQLVSVTADDPAEIPDELEVTYFTTQLSPRTKDTGEACCPAAGAFDLQVNLNVPLVAEHDEPVVDEGIHPMLEAESITGVAFLNSVGNGDATRPKGSRHGVAYTNLAVSDGAHPAILVPGDATPRAVVMAGIQAEALGAFTAVGAGQATGAKGNLNGVVYQVPVTNDGQATSMAQHSEAISGVTSRGGVALAGVEAKTFDGAALPNPVAEGDATRVAGSLYGVGYTMPVSQDGGVSPIAEDEVALAVDGRIGLMTAGAEVQAAAPAPLAAGLAVALNTNTLKHLIIAGYEFPDNHNRASETDPLDTKHGTTPFTDATVTAAPLVRYFPDENGHSLADRKATSLQAVIRGGVDALAADVTATLTIEGTNGMIDPATVAVRWEDITLSVLNTNTGASGVASWTSVGVAYTYLLLCLGNANMTHFRVKVEWDAVPDVAATAGFARMTPRTRAL